MQQGLTLVDDYPQGMLRARDICWRVLTPTQYAIGETFDFVRDASGKWVHRDEGDGYEGPRAALPRLLGDGC